MQVSQSCQKFVAGASANRWREAVIALNGLNMYEMLRSLKALDAADIQGLRTALSTVGSNVNAPRIDYALTIVETNRVPNTAPGDLATTGQVTIANQFVARPRSILQERIPRAQITGHNVGLTAVNSTLMQQLFGAPRTSYSQQCQPIENATLRRRIIQGSNVGPFNVNGLDSAVNSLRTVMVAIQRDQRLVYRVLATAGMLCVRNVRGSTTNISNHSWGTAIDLRIGSEPDIRGDNNVQFGLLLIAPIFNAEGWYWGIGFDTEDAMHFEAGRALAERWAHA